LFGFGNDLFCGPGVYLIYQSVNTNPLFYLNKSNLNLVKQESVEFLENKWTKINSKNRTDIVYIGKGVNLKSRIRSLMRFGHGKTNKHFGGEWLWQIQNLKELRILISSCPIGQEKGYEKCLLNKFKNDHSDWPLCNRKGGENVPDWNPEMINRC